MAISAAVATSWKVELLKAIHDLSASAGDAMKLALYLASANLDATTTVFTTTGEVTGTNYVSGGNTLTNLEPISITTKGLASFGTLTFTNVTISNVDGCLIYNSSKANRAMQIFKFAALASATAADFVINFPAQNDANSIYRIA